MKLVPGVTLNLSKSGGSLSFGPRGGHFTMSPRGNRITGGVPGTGLFYTQRVGGSGKSRRTRSRRATPPAPTVPPSSRLTMGFFKRLFTPKDEENLVDGMREFVSGHRDRAREYLEQASHLADGAFLAGMLALDEGDLDAAMRHLEMARRKSRQLGTYLDRYGVDATVSIAVTPELAAHVRPSRHGVLLTLVEVYQRLGRLDRAQECLERLRVSAPDDMVATLSLVELLLDTRGDDRATLQRIVRIGAGVENESAVHAALLLYKGRALARLGLHTAARDTLTAALRRHKDRPADLLHAIRYERALVYDAMGNDSRAREEFERLYAEDPGYEDVAKRLGLKRR